MWKVESQRARILCSDSSTHCCQNTLVRTCTCLLRPLYTGHKLACSLGTMKHSTTVSLWPESCKHNIKGKCFLSLAQRQSSRLPSQNTINFRGAKAALSINHRPEHNRLSSTDQTHVDKNLLNFSSFIMIIVRPSDR